MSSQNKIVREIRKFAGFDEAETADREYMRSLTPEQRLELLFELIRRGQGEPEPRLKREER